MQWPWIVAMFTTAVLVQGQPQYEVQVRGPIDFIYRPGEENTLANGRCCSLEQGTSCLRSCDNQIILCFREMQHPSSDTNLAVCPLGRMVFTPPTMNTDIITFNATIAATTTTYPGSFQLIYSIYAILGALEVESDRASLNRAIQNRTFPLTLQTFGAERTVLSTGGIRVVCKEGYFGPDCDCTPQNNTKCVGEVITPEPTTISGLASISMITPTVSSSIIEGTNGGTVFTQKAYFSTSGNIFQPISTITIEHSSTMTHINTVDTTVGHISTTMQELVTTSAVSSDVSVTTTNVNNDRTTSAMFTPLLTSSTNSETVISTNFKFSTAGHSTTEIFVSKSSNKIVDKTATILPTPYTSNVIYTTFTTDSSSENCADIVPIVAGGVAGGLVVLLLILIVNIVLVIVVIKIKYINHCSNKQGSSVEEHIELGANPLYEINRFAHSEQNDDYEVV